MLTICVSFHLIISTCCWRWLCLVLCFTFSLRFAASVHPPGSDLERLPGRDGPTVGAQQHPRQPRAVHARTPRPPHRRRPAAVPGRLRDQNRRAATRGIHRSRTSGKESTGPEHRVRAPTCFPNSTILYNCSIWSQFSFFICVLQCFGDSVMRVVIYTCTFTGWCKEGRVQISGLAFPGNHQELSETTFTV